MIIPRRIQLDKLTPAELSIRNAVLAVEEAGTDPLLTDAVVLLQQARDKVADWVDSRLSHSQHITDGSHCWCEPEIELMENGAKLIKHRARQ